MIFDEFLIKSLVKVHKVPNSQVNEGKSTFVDLSPLCATPKAFRMLVDAFAQKYIDSSITHIVAVEANAFQFAAPIAYTLNKPLIFIRKNKKLPGDWIEESILNAEPNFLSLPQNMLPKEAKVLLFDDRISTGNTIRTAATLLRTAQAQIEDVACIVVDADSEGAQAIQELDFNLFSLLSI